MELISPPLAALLLVKASLVKTRLSLRFKDLQFRHPTFRFLFQVGLNCPKEHAYELNYQMLLMPFPVFPQTSCAALDKAIAMIFVARLSASSQLLPCLLEGCILEAQTHFCQAYSLPAPQTKECPW